MPTAISIAICTIGHEQHLYELAREERRRGQRRAVEALEHIGVAIGRDAQRERLESGVDDAARDHARQEVLAKVHAVATSWPPKIEPNSTSSIMGKKKMKIICSRERKNSLSSTLARDHARGTSSLAASLGTPNDLEVHVLE